MTKDGRATIAANVEPVITITGSSNPGAFGLWLADAVRVIARAYHEVLRDPQGNQMPVEEATQRIAEVLLEQLAKAPPPLEIESVSEVEETVFEAEPFAPRGPKKVVHNIRRLKNSLT